MAVLPAADRQRIWRGVMRFWSGLTEPIAITKADLQEAVDAADAWVDANAASYNTALPQPARNALTPAQKSLILCGVVLMRFNLELLKRIFGEVD